MRTSVGIWTVTSSGDRMRLVLCPGYGRMPALRGLPVGRGYLTQSWHRLYRMLGLSHDFTGSTYEIDSGRDDSGEV